MEQPGNASVKRQRVGTPDTTAVLSAADVTRKRVAAPDPFGNESESDGEDGMAPVTKPPGACTLGCRTNTGRQRQRVSCTQTCLPLPSVGECGG